MNLFRKGREHEAQLRSLLAIEQSRRQACEQAAPRTLGSLGLLGT